MANNPGEWYEEKQREANAWHNLLLEAVRMEAPQSVIRVIKKHLELARYADEDTK